MQSSIPNIFHTNTMSTANFYNHTSIIHVQGSSPNSKNTSMEEFNLGEGELMSDQEREIGPIGTSDR